MNVIIGIDVGGSTTKIVGYYEDGKLIGREQVEAADPLTSAYGALGKFVNENKLSLAQVKQIVLTGVGASLFKDEIYGIPARQVDEFQAIGLGGLALSKKEEGLIVSMGTGTAFVRAGKDGIRHIGGSGVGGGTVLGLCSKLCNARSFETVVDMAHRGDLKKVDLNISDICSGDIATLSPEVTASNFGNLREAFQRSELLKSGYRRALILNDAPVLIIPEEEYVAEEADTLYRYTFRTGGSDEVVCRQLPALNGV